MKKKKKTTKKETNKNLKLFLPMGIVISLLSIMIISLVIVLIVNNKPFNKEKYVDKIVTNVFLNKNISIEKLLFSNQ